MNIDDDFIIVRRALSDATDEVRGSFEEIFAEFHRVRKSHELYRKILQARNSMKLEYHYFKGGFCE